MYKLQKKLLLSLFSIILFCDLFAENQVKLYLQESSFSEKLERIFTLHKIDFEFSDLENTNAQSLYIISDLLFQGKLPQNYILYNSYNLNHIALDDELLSKIENAIAIWDASLENINKYNTKIFNYYYLPGENYEFIDPIILVCHLPLLALNNYKEVLIYSNKRDGDISSHLPTIFCHTVLKKPNTILESGVSSGQSTYAFYKAAQLFNSRLIGIDIYMQWKKSYDNLNNAVFLCMDDLDFMKYYKNNAEFKHDKKFDIIFIDTSHLYEHTMKEIKLFLPLLNNKGIMMFHDSHVTPLNNNTRYYRLNNTFGDAPGNTRGVTQAIKDSFGINFDEYKYFNSKFIKNGTPWEIIHYPFCNGLTIIKN